MSYGARAESTRGTTDDRAFSGRERGVISE